MKLRGGRDRGGIGREGIRDGFDQNTFSACRKFSIKK